MRSDRVTSGAARRPLSTVIHRRAALSVAATAALAAAGIARGQPAPVSATVTGSAAVSTAAVGDASGDFLYYTASSSAALTFNGNQPILVPISSVAGQNLNWSDSATWADPGIAPVFSRVAAR